MARRVMKRHREILTKFIGFGSLSCLCWASKSLKTMKEAARAVALLHNESLTNIESGRFSLI